MFVGVGWSYFDGAVIVIVLFVIISSRTQHRWILNDQFNTFHITLCGYIYRETFCSKFQTPENESKNMALCDMHIRLLPLENDTPISQSLGGTDNSMACTSVRPFICPSVCRYFVFSYFSTCLHII